MYMYMYSTMTCIVVLHVVLGSLRMHFPIVDIYCIALGHNGVSRTRDVQISGCPHIIHVPVFNCAEGLHFSALV